MPRSAGVSAGAEAAAMAVAADSQGASLLQDAAEKCGAAGGLGLRLQAAQAARYALRRTFSRLRCGKRLGAQDP